MIPNYLAENAHLGLIIADKSQKILDANLAMERMSGHSRHELRKRHGVFFNPFDPRGELLQGLSRSLVQKRPWTGQVGGVRPDGVLWSAFVQIFPQARTDNAERIVVFYHPAHLSAMNAPSYTDLLTGLPGEQAFIHRLQERIDQLAPGHGLVTIRADINSFSEVNTTYGTEVGDALLKGVANRLLQALPCSIYVARIRGDDIALASGMVRKERLQTAAKRLVRHLQKAFETPIAAGGWPLLCRLDCGVACYPIDADNAVDLFSRTSHALEEARLHHARVRYYRPGGSHKARRRFWLAGELHRALENNDGLKLYYQPKVSLPDRQVVSVEGLLRWHHASEGNIPVHEFVHLAEERGLMRLMTRRVIELAVSDIESWRTKDLDCPMVAMNVPAELCADGSLLIDLRQVLDSTDVSPAAFSFELTERTIIPAGHELAVQLKKLKRLGVKFALDDFGVGYSSMGVLYSLPFDMIKLDKSFTDALISDQRAREVAKALLGLANGLQMTAIAEGIETEAHCRAVMDLGYRFGQGYLFGRPLPVGEFTERYLTS